MSRRTNAAASAAMLATLVGGTLLLAPPAFAAEPNVQTCIKATNKLDDTKKRLDVAEKAAAGLDVSVSRLNYLLGVVDRTAEQIAELDKIQAVLSLRAIRVVDLDAKNAACKSTTTPTSTVTATPSAPPTTTVTSTEHITQYDGGSVARIPSRAPETGGGPVEGTSWAELFAVVSGTVVALGAYGASRVRRSH